MFTRLLIEVRECFIVNDCLLVGLTECEKVLNLLVLLLPVENRLTLLAILSFMRKLVEHESQNKMNKHNVAMIIAPSIFPPRLKVDD